MFDIVGKRKWFLVVSLLLIVPGLVAMVISYVLSLIHI